jgi:hypothetical protein
VEDVDGRTITNLLSMMFIVHKQHTLLGLTRSSTAQSGFYARAIQHVNSPEMTVTQNMNVALTDDWPTLLPITPHGRRDIKGVYLHSQHYPPPAVPY